MRTVFDRFFVDNLQRLHARTTERKNIAQDFNPKAEKFQEVLSTLETKNPVFKSLFNPPEAEKAAQKDTPPSLAREAKESPNESANQPQRARLSSSPVIAINRGDTAQDLNYTPLGGVKESEQAVKTMIAKLPPAYSERPPSMPQIINEENYAARTKSLAEAGVDSLQLDYFGKIPKGRAGSQPFSAGQVKEIVAAAGRFHGVDPELSLAVAQAESAYRTDAISKDGHATKGVFQLLDSTAHDLRKRAGIDEPYDPFDPGMNSFLGVSYLRRLMNMFSSDTKIDSRRRTVAANSAEDLEKLALAAFNAGEGRVIRAQERARLDGANPAEFDVVSRYLPASTRDYVAKVGRIKSAMAAETNLRFKV